MNKVSLKKILPSLIITFLGSGIIYLLLFMPVSSKIGLAFRYDFSSIVLVLSICLTICFQIPGIFGKFAFFCLTAAVFTIPVSGLWNSGQSEQYILGGIIPFSDARYYYMDARRLLEGSLYSSGAARRPLFTAMLSSILWLTNQNLYLTIGILIFVISSAVYLTVLEIRKQEGVFPGILFFVFIFLFLRLLLGKTLSEMAGLPLGLLSFVFFYRGATTHQIKWIIVGLFLMSLAQNARPGALLILPALIIWSAWFFRGAKKFNLRVFVYASCAVAMGFVINLLFFYLLASSDSAPFGNFSHTLYGLAQGGLGWTKIYEDHPEIWMMAPNIQADYIYSRSLEIIRNKPMNLVKGVISSYQTFFSLDDYYGSLCWVGPSGMVGNIAKCGVYFLMGTGLYEAIRNFKKPSSSLFIAAFLGICLSVPFAPPLDSNHMRVYAASIPFFVALPCIGFAFLINKLSWKFPAKLDNPSPSLIPAISLAIVLLIGITIIPVFIKLTIPKSIPTNISCSSGLSQISFRVLPGNHIKIVDQGSIDHDWVPNLQKNNFRTLVHNLPNYEAFPLFTAVKPGQTILADLELNQMKEMILIADWDSLNHSTTVQSACAIAAKDPLLRDYIVYFAD